MKIHQYYKYCLRILRVGEDIYYKWPQDTMQIYDKYKYTYGHMVFIKRGQQILIEDIYRAYAGDTVQAFCYNINNIFNIDET